MKNPNSKLRVLAFFLLVLAALACNFQTDFNQTAPSSPPASQPTNAPAQPNPEAVTVTLTEGQLNQLIQQTIQYDPNETVEDLLLRIQEGEIKFSGTVQQGNFRLPLQISLLAEADGQGGVRFEITSASVGPLPLPDSIRQQITDQLNLNLRNSIKELTGSIFIEDISIGNGVIIVRGWNE